MFLCLLPRDWVSERASISFVCSSALGTRLGALHKFSEHALNATTRLSHYLSFPFLVVIALLKNPCGGIWTWCNFSSLCALRWGGAVYMCLRGCPERRWKRKLFFWMRFSPEFDLQSVNAVALSSWCIGHRFWAGVCGGFPSVVGSIPAVQRHAWGNLGFVSRRNFASLVLCLLSWHLPYSYTSHRVGFPRVATEPWKWGQSKLRCTLSIKYTLDWKHSYKHWVLKLLYRKR